MLKINFPKKLISGILVCSLLFSLVGCDTKKTAGESSISDGLKTIPQTIKSDGPLSNYIITGTLDPEKKSLSGSEVVHYVNTEANPLNEVYFHLYPNAFRTETTAPFLFDSFASAYPNGFSPGSIDILSAQIDGKDLALGTDTQISGGDSSLLRIALPSPLKPGSQVEIKLTFNIAIPPATERFGIGEGYVNLGNWYPIIAAYDSSGWNLDPYYPIGDPFYSDVSDYTVTITAPKKYTLAASGTLTNRMENENGTTWSFEAFSMRDFAIVASALFQTEEAMAGNTKVISYFYKEDAELGKRALEFGVNSINTFNEKFGTYPYPTYSICETAFPSGMEYPGLVYIAKDLYANKDDLTDLAITTIHETGHQYFYGLVGDDQVDEAWLDEAFATYAEITYLEEYLGEDAAKEQSEYNIRSGEASLESKVFDGKVVKPLSEYKNWDDYGPAVYSVGATLLIKLRENLGDEVYWKVMKTYFTSYRFKIATTEDFLRIAEEVSGKDLSPLFKKYLGFVG